MVLIKEINFVINETIFPDRTVKESEDVGRRPMSP